MQAFGCVALIMFGTLYAVSTLPFVYQHTVVLQIGLFTSILNLCVTVVIGYTFMRVNCLASMLGK
jgi:accessory gene regulator protein AgrB